MADVQWCPGCGDLVGAAGLWFVAALPVFDHDRTSVPQGERRRFHVGCAPVPHTGWRRAG